MAVQITWSFGKVYSRSGSESGMRQKGGFYTACVEFMVRATIFLDELNIVLGVPD